MLDGSRPALLTASLLVLLVACGTPPQPDEGTVKVPQSITFAALDDRLTTDPPFELVATATSGLPVSFTATGACSVDAATATLAGVVGECSITASQPGDDAYLAADDVVRTFAVDEPAIRQVGFVLLSETGPSDARVVDGSGTFVERDEPLEASFGEDPFGDSIGTCSVTTASASSGDPSPSPDTSGTPIAAGASLTVRDVAATYATLVADGVGSYVLDGDASAALPTSGLALDVPGETFPRYLGASFVATAPLAFDAGFDPGSLTADTTFAWQGTGLDTSVVLLIGGDGDTVVSCIVPDDGDYGFDADTRAALDAAGYTTGSLQAAGRLSVTAHRQADAILLLGALRLTSYESVGPAALLRTLAHRAVQLEPAETTD